MTPSPFQAKAEEKEIFTVSEKPEEEAEVLTPKQEELRKRIIDAFYQEEQDYDEGFPVGGKYLVSTCGEPDEDYDDFIRTVREFVEKESAEAEQRGAERERERLKGEVISHSVLHPWKEGSLYKGDTWEISKKSLNDIFAARSALKPE